MASSQAGVSHMKLAEVILDKYYWHTVSRPGFDRHITLEEAAAHNWALESRLLRPGERGCRCLHLGSVLQQLTVPT